MLYTRKGFGKDFGKGFRKPIESPPRIAISYCNLEFQATHPDTPKESYIFHVEDPTEPDLVLEAPSFLVSAEYNNRDHNVIAGGCYNGQVGREPTKKCDQ